jgi:hypothetical protein
MRVAIILLLLSASAFGQMRGGGRVGFGGRFAPQGRPGVFFHGGVARPLSSIPQAGRPFFPGVPASVTSLGPCGFTPCFSPFFRNGFFFRHGFRHFHSFPFWGGVWGGGYPIYYGSDYYGSDYQTQPQPIVQQPSEPQRVEIVVLDQRSGKQKDSEPAEAAPARPKYNDDPDPPASPAIFVFKDGSRKELANYAIMRGQLIDVTDGKIFRIPLEKLDRDKTLEMNAKAGRAIQLP